jgi:dipeptidyl aminopeptidase/acylaminoacyl peptidase
MRYENLRVGLCLLTLCVFTTFGFGQKRAMGLDDLAKLVNVGGPQVSPDGKWIAYTASHVDVGEDKNVSELWMVSWDGTQDVHLTYGPEGVGSPRWSLRRRGRARRRGRRCGCWIGAGARRVS